MIANTDTEKLDALRADVRRLLGSVGQRGRCEACGVDIWFVRHRSGKRLPYTADARMHAVTCPKRQPVTV